MRKRRPPRLTLIRPAMGIVAAAAMLFAGAGASAQASLEYQVKATFLVRFAAFVTWPPQSFSAPGAPLAICVVGADPFGAALDRALQGQTVDGRPIVARRLARIDRNSDCHIVYAGRAQQSASEILAQVEGRPVLTVTDSARGQTRGMIHFTLQENRVRFYADEQTASQAGLKISSRLLDLAVSVVGRR